MSRAAAALAALVLAALAAPAHADGLVDNVNGIAIDRDGAQARFTGLLITPDGKVAKLLARGERRPDKLDFRLDGRGRTLIPGLIDGHGRLIDLGLSLLTLDLGDTRSLAEAQARIAAYVATNPSRKWILGGGWDQERWGLGRSPTAADLDAVAPGVPVYLTDAAGEAGWANSAAMRAAGVAATAKAPVGGRIDKGIFTGNARALMAAAVPSPLPRERDLALERAQARLLALGVTTVTDMGTTIDDWQAYRRAGDRGALSVRIVGYGRGLADTLLIAGSAPTPWLYDGHLKLTGMMLTLDGALGSRGAWLKADYADAPGQRGLTLQTPAQLRNTMTRGAMDGFQVAVAATGDAAGAEVLSAIDEIADTYPGDRRWRIEHAEVVDPADLPRFARHGAVASMQPARAADARVAAARLGTARLAGAQAWRSMLGNGVSLAFGGIGTASGNGPFATIAAATTRADDQRLTVDQALRAVTRGAAFAAFAEDRIGALEPGRAADFVIVDRDIALAPPAGIGETQVLETWIGGKRVYVKE